MMTDAEIAKIKEDAQVVVTNMKRKQKQKISHMSVSTKGLQTYAENVLKLIEEITRLQGYDSSGM